MSFMNSVQRGYIPLVLIALIVSLQAVLAGKEVACDAHFWADEGPNPRISCVTLEYPTRDHKCKPHSCTGRSKQGRQSSCLAAVQDKAGDWWECNYFEDGEGNNGAISESLYGPRPPI
ncbi:hypothetical protein PSHT_04439 [Puccinia striiformis]|uniref:Secreted protein n=1 Tax=Puccinia striiformis TaxID=27350 RepID=A0A2S4WD10_9BASI|nr:hypothetical protein PSHT_04439 [Puccinia striiformis]